MVTLSSYQERWFLNHKLLSNRKIRAVWGGNSFDLNLTLSRIKDIRLRFLLRFSVLVAHLWIFFSSENLGLVRFVRRKWPCSICTRANIFYFHSDEVARTSHYSNHSYIVPNAFNLYICLLFLLYSIQWCAFSKKKPDEHGRTCTFYLCPHSPAEFYHRYQAPKNVETYGNFYLLCCSRTSYLCFIGFYLFY